MQPLGIACALRAIALVVWTLVNCSAPCVYVHRCQIQIYSVNCDHFLSLLGWSLGL